MNSFNIIIFFSFIVDKYTHSVILSYVSKVHKAWFIICPLLYIFAMHYQKLIKVQTLDYSLVFIPFKWNLADAQEEISAHISLYDYVTFSETWHLLYSSADRLKVDFPEQCPGKVLAMIKCNLIQKLENWALFMRSHVHSECEILHYIL